MSAGETTPRPGPGTRALRQLGLAVAASFVAGLSVGVALPKIREAFAGPAADDPWAVYVTALTDDYGLSNDQVRKLRMVMAAWEQERNELLSRHAGALPRPLQNDINDANRRCDERIKSLLTEAQLRRFLQHSNPVPFPAGTVQSTKDD